jgi:iron(III) transport system ATP-binding protein
MSGLAVRGLRMRYGDTAVVDGVDFDVPAGSLTALLGPSGCGKTTVLRLVAGLETPQAGTVHIEGRDVTALAPEHRGVGLVFQSYALFPHLSVEQNILFTLQAASYGGDDARARATAALDLVGLQGLAQRRPPDLSGGQQQRVALARALALAPAVLLLDEPLSNVDTRLRRNLREEIRALQKQLQLTVVYVTHDQHEALAVSDQVVLMCDGRVAQRGSPEDLYQRPRTEFVAAFMGEAGIFDGLCTPEGRVWLGPLEVAPAQDLAPGPVRIAVRPEAWRLAPATGSGLPGSVLRRTYVGRAVEYILATPVGQVLAFSRHTVALDAGAPVSLFLERHGVCVLAPESPRFVDSGASRSSWG